MTGPMSSQRFGVLADDLTGAHAAAAQLAGQGRRTSVVWSSEALLSCPDDAVVVDMRTRDRSERPSAVASAWARSLRDAGFTRLELRVDTMLRGNTVAELAGVIEGLDWPDALVVAVPAYPRAGRTTIAGAQHIRDESTNLVIDNVATRLFGDETHCIIPMKLLRQGDATGVERVLASRRDGVNRVLFDAESDEDLRHSAEIAEELHDLVPRLVTVSSGAWLRYYPRPSSSRFVVVVVASPTAANVTQLGFLRDLLHVAAIDAGSSLDVIRAVFGQRPTVVVVDTTSLAAGNGPPAKMAADTAQDVARAGEAAGLLCAGFVVTGGDAATHLVDALGATGLRVVREVAPLCPQGRLVGGPWSSLPVITKGGVIGDADTLHVLVSALAITPRQRPDAQSSTKECHA